MGLTCFEPEGAFYVFPCIKSTGLSSEEFCQELIHQERVAVVPGNAFGDCGEGYVRVSYSYSTKAYYGSAFTHRAFRKIAEGYMNENSGSGKNQPFP